MTTDNLTIVPKNDADDAVLTVSSAVTGFEAVNTQNTVRSRVWRSTSNAGQTFTGVWSASRTISHASLHAHLCHAGSWRLQLFSDAGATVQVLDATGGATSATSYTASEPYVWSEGSNDPFRSNSPTWVWFAETLARSFKLTLSGTPAQAYWQIGRLWLGRGLRLAVNPAYGLQLTIVDNTDTDITRGGSARTNLGAYWRMLQFDLQGINDNEYATWMDIMTQAGRGRDVLASVFKGDGTRKEALHTIAGKFPSLDTIARQVSWLTKTVSIREN